MGQYSFTLHFLLQAENAQAGDHLVRVSGSSSWYSNRAISAEIELEPGRYEVLPKIAATRDKDKPLVEDVVKKAAEENPQKLRQIGLNYDIAHAKGGFEEEEAEKKRKAEIKEKKLKDEEKKKEKAEEGKAEQEKKKDNSKTASEGESKEAAEKSEPEPSKKEDTTPEKKEKELVAEESKECDDSLYESAPETAKSQSEESPNPWNAVAVIGLRAYSKDPDLVVTLVVPKDPEEASMLDVDGVSGAGATT
jgi:hypothetical protein